MNKPNSSMSAAVAAITAAFCFTSGIYMACVDYSDPNAGATEAGVAPPASSATTATTFTKDASSASLLNTLPDGSTSCEARSFRGGAAGAVVCPGTESCACSGPDICCLSKIDAVSGVCTSLGSCRDLALQCDGPEDCASGDGGNFASAMVCCLEDRNGGGASCKSAAGGCDDGKWLCRNDGDCVDAPLGSHCAPMDLGTAGVDDVGLDGIVGVCGK